MSRHVSLKVLTLLAAIGANTALPSLTQAGGGPDLPAYAKPGQCFGRVTVPAVYSTQVTQELVSRGHSGSRVVRGAVVEKSVQRVLVRPARTVTYRTAGVYRTVVKTKWIEGRRSVQIEPAVYDTVKEKILVEAAHAEWRPTSQPLAYGESRPGQTMLQATGEVWCRVLVPARYEFRHRKVLVQGERRTEYAEPSRKIVTKTRVLVKRGQLVTRTQPAVYRNVVTKRVVRPAVIERTAGKDVYRSVQRKVIVRQESQGWAQVFCGGQLSSEFVYKVQNALASLGYDPGPIDGVDRPAVYAALSRFQHDRHLARGQLTIETGRALGVY